MLAVRCRLLSLANEQADLTVLLILQILVRRPVKTASATDHTAGIDRTVGLGDDGSRCCV